MIETYSFLAAFTAQILVVSVLLPISVIRRIRTQATKIPTERLAHLGADFPRAQERFLTQIRALNAAAIVLGLLLLWWLFNLMTQRPDWDKGPLKLLVFLYALVQVLPLARVERRYSEMLWRFLPEKRKAVLRRRVLFDFVSPLLILFAVLAYLLFAAFVIYLLQHPFPGFRGLSHIIGPTVIYALYAFIIYKNLYGRSEPLETHEHRLHRIGVTVRFWVYFCIAFVAYKSLRITLRMLELHGWEPFALSVFLMVAVLGAIRLTEPPRQANADDASSSPSVDGHQQSKVRS